MQQALHCSMSDRWGKLIMMPTQLVGDILNCYIPCVDYMSLFNICDVMDH